MLDIIILGIIFIIFIIGYKKGALLMVYNFATIFMAILITKLLSPKVIELINNIFFEKIINIVNEKSDILYKENITFQEKRDIIENLKLPQIFIDNILENSNSDTYNKLGVSGIDEYIISSIATLVITIIGVVVTFIIALILVKLFANVLGVVNLIPGISFINRMLGGGIGVLISYLTINLLMLILPINATFFNKSMEFISESKIGMYIYENNIIYNTVIMYLYNG